MGELIKIEDGALFSASNLLDLILCRGAATCNINFHDDSQVNEWKRKKICQGHRLDYLLKFLINWNLLTEICLYDTLQR